MTFFSNFQLGQMKNLPKTTIFSHLNRVNQIQELVEKSCQYTCRFCFLKRNSSSFICSIIAVKNLIIKWQIPIWRNNYRWFMNKRSHSNVNIVMQALHKKVEGLLFPGLLFPGLLFPGLLFLDICSPPSKKDICSPDFCSLDFCSPKDIRSP